MRNPIDRDSHPDSDLIEDISDEEMYEIVKAAQREALLKQKEEPERKPMPRWLFWTIVIVFLTSSFSFFLQAFSLPVIDFLRTSAKLSQEEDIQIFKEAVVSVVVDGSKGTGFSISEDGYILTNYHVIEEHSGATISFPKAGSYTALVVEKFPEIDLALLKINDTVEVPFLDIASFSDWQKGDKIRFIGNPLGFLGIANEGHIIDAIQLRNWDEHVLMIQAPIYKGNSGSPVFNEDGKVIGVIFATLNHSTHGKVGLFVPIELFHLYRENSDKKTSLLGSA